jgi:hypothetical protein
MDTDTLQMLRSSLEHVLTEDGDRLSERLSSLGWDEVLADDAPGALQVLFEMKGRTLSGADAIGPVLSRSVADALGDRDLVGATVVLPASLHPDRPSASLEGDRLTVSGVVTSHPAVGLPLVVPVVGGLDRVGLVLVPAGRDWSFQPFEGMDPSLGLLRAEAKIDASTAMWMSGDKGSDAWQAVAALGRWTLAAELVGIGHHVIAAAVAYAGERVQYGRPIGSFQAVQHRLAGAYASVVGASDVVAEAATSGSPWTALVAKALAGRAAETACTQAQQTYGAIGFTWEHEFHRYLRRTYVLDRLFGAWRGLELEIGTHLYASRKVPRIGTL